MTTIPELVTAQDYEGLVKFCENFELTVRHTKERQRVQSFRHVLTTTLCII
jgi:hypothetical protein